MDRNNIKGNPMERSNLLFLTAVRRGYRLLSNTRLLLCLFILVSVGLISGCDRDIKDLAEEDLVICWLTIDDSTLYPQQTAQLTAELVYTCDYSELRYKWSIVRPNETTDAGEIYDNGQRALYVAPANPGTYTIKFEVCNGALRVSDAVVVTIRDPDAPKGDEMKDEVGDKMSEATDNQDENKPQVPKQLVAAENQNAAAVEPGKEGK